MLRHVLRHGFPLRTEAADGQKNLQGHAICFHLESHVDYGCDAAVHPDAAPPAVLRGQKRTGENPDFRNDL